MKLQLQASILTTVSIFDGQPSVGDTLRKNGRSIGHAEAVTAHHHPTHKNSDDESEPKNPNEYWEEMINGDEDVEFSSDSNADQL